MFTDMIKWKTSIVLNFNSQEIFHFICWVFFHREHFYKS